MQAPSMQLLTLQILALSDSFSKNQSILFYSIWLQKEQLQREEVRARVGFLGSAKGCLAIWGSAMWSGSVLWFLKKDLQYWGDSYLSLLLLSCEVVWRTRHLALVSSSSCQLLNFRSQCISAAPSRIDEKDSTCTSYSSSPKMKLSSLERMRLMTEFSFDYSSVMYWSSNLRVRYPRQVFWMMVAACEGEYFCAKKSCLSLPKRLLPMVDSFSEKTIRLLLLLNSPRGTMNLLPSWLFFSFFFRFCLVLGSGCGPRTLQGSRGLLPRMNQTLSWCFRPVFSLAVRLLLVRRRYSMLLLRKGCRQSVLAGLLVTQPEQALMILEFDNRERFSFCCGLRLGSELLII